MEVVYVCYIFMLKDEWVVVSKEFFEDVEKVIFFDDEKKEYIEKVC